MVYKAAFFIKPLYQRPLQRDYFFVNTILLSHKVLQLPGDENRCGP
jgi:hypothetical protein